MDTKQAKSLIEAALSDPNAPISQTTTEAEVRLTDEGEVLPTDEAYADFIMAELERVFVLTLLEVLDHE